MKKIELLAIILASLATGLALAALVLLQSLLGIIIAMGGIALGVFSLILYIRSAHKKAMQYPLVPPEGKPDIYLPRTDIPRPVIADFRKLEEKKRKFARIRKLIRKKERRRKR